MDMEELKRQLAEYKDIREREDEERRKEKEKNKRKPGRPKKQEEPKRRPGRPKKDDYEQRMVDGSYDDNDDSDLDRFRGDSVNLTPEEFQALMKHAEIGQQAIQQGGVSQSPPPAPAPDRSQEQNQQTLGEQIEADKRKEAEELQIPEGSIQHISQGKKGGRFFNRNPKEPEPSEYEYSGSLSRPTILYYDTDNTCQLVTGKLGSDGSMKINERLFDFSEGQPSILTMSKGKGRSSAHPFYILRYDNMKPIDINDYPDSNPTPEQASRLIELSTLQTLTQIEGAKPRKAVLIIFALVGVMTGFVIKLMLGLTGIW